LAPQGLPGRGSWHSYGITTLITGLSAYDQILTVGSCWPVRTAGSTGGAAPVVWLFADPMTRKLEERVFANGTWSSLQEFYDQCCAHNLERRPWAGHRRVRRDAGSNSGSRGGKGQASRFERQQRVLFCHQFVRVVWPKPLLGSVRLGRSTPTTHVPAVLPGS